ncbi:MAG TPA: DUF433 domain-containing protein [Dehalococcoidia bacterium]|nr:DUF433 domain-containing protein [Dehalococcoidia bacterium]
MTSEIAPRIIVDKNVRFGKPVIKGTRVDVQTVVEQLAAGLAVDDVMKEYGISREDVLAALSYAAHILSLEEVHSVD